LEQIATDQGWQKNGFLLKNLTLKKVGFCFKNTIFSCIIFFIDSIKFKNIITKIKNKENVSKIEQIFSLFRRAYEDADWPFWQLWRGFFFFENVRHIKNTFTEIEVFVKISILFEGIFREV
jgi:hypothetical protein